MNRWQFDWDYLAVIGLLLIIVGVWITWGIGPALLASGIAAIVAALGGAAVRA